VSEPSTSAKRDVYVRVLSTDARGHYLIPKAEHDAARRHLQREFPEMGKTELSEAADELVLAPDRMSWLDDAGERVYHWSIPASEAVRRSMEPSRKLQRETIRRRTPLEVRARRQLLFVLTVGSRAAVPPRACGREVRSTRRVRSSSGSGRDPSDPEPPPALASVLAAARGRGVPQMIAAGISAALEGYPDAYLLRLWAGVSARAVVVHKDAS
jgi:hypothetical protein